LSRLLDTPNQIRSGYIKREDAAESVGRSPKTIYRHIKKAIQSSDESSKALLDHCQLQLLDGEVLDGRQVESMELIDQHRSKGRVPTWYLDPQPFADHFNQTQNRSDGDSPERSVAKPSRGATATSDGRLVEQYEQRIKEKDERIEELQKDKQQLRVQLNTGTMRRVVISGRQSWVGRRVWTTPRHSLSPPA